MVLIEITKEFDKVAVISADDIKRFVYFRDYNKERRWINRRRCVNDMTVDEIADQHSGVCESK